MMMEKPTFNSRLARLRGLAAGAVAAVVLTGCGAVNHVLYKTTGDVMQGFSKDHTVPYLMHRRPGHELRHE